MIFVFLLPIRAQIAANSAANLLQRPPPVHGLRRRDPPVPAAGRAMPQRPATGSGKERRFPSRFFPCEKAVTEDTRQRCKGAGHDYPDMRHAACCSGAQPVRMKARMGIRKPPVTPGTVPRTGQRQDEGKGGERRRRKSGKARPMEGAPGRLPQMRVRQKPITKKGLQLSLQAFGFPGAEGQN